MNENHCDKCNTDKYVEMIIFNGTNQIPVRYIEEKRTIEKIEIDEPKENIWERLKNVRL